MDPLLKGRIELPQNPKPKTDHHFFVPHHQMPCICFAEAPVQPPNTPLFSDSPRFVDPTQLPTSFDKNTQADCAAAIGTPLEPERAKPSSLSIAEPHRPLQLHRRGGRRCAPALQSALHKVLKIPFRGAPAAENYVMDFNINRVWLGFYPKWRRIWPIHPHKARIMVVVPKPNYQIIVMDKNHGRHQWKLVVCQPVAGFIYPTGAKCCASTGVGRPWLPQECCWAMERVGTLTTQVADGWRQAAAEVILSELAATL